MTTTSKNSELNKIVNTADPAISRSITHQNISLILKECQKYNITDKAQIAYILATAEHESNLGKRMTEEWGPTKEQLRYEGKKDLDNNQAGDGFRYRGRGFVQITGRDRYTSWSKELGVDLVNQPELATRPDIAARILVQGMKEGGFRPVQKGSVEGGYRLGRFIHEGARIDFNGARNIVNDYDAQQVASVTRRANRYYETLKTVEMSQLSEELLQSNNVSVQQGQSPDKMPLKIGAVGEAVSQLQKRLAQLGCNPGAADGIFGSDTEKAVKQFQQNQGIKPASGVVDAVTQKALAEASPIRHQQVPEVTGVLKTPVHVPINSKFGLRPHPVDRATKFHYGIDLAAPQGTSVKAADGGKVIFADYAGDAGNTVVLDHGNGYATRYFHLSRINVQVDQLVKQGEKIGTVGSTGKSTGPHLHFELRHGGSGALRGNTSGSAALDPEKYLGKEYQQVARSQSQHRQLVDDSAELQAIIFTNAVETVLDHRTRPAADASRHFKGNTYDIKQQDDTLSVTAKGRGEILRVEAGRIVTNKVSEEDVSRLSHVAFQINHEQQKQYSTQPTQQSNSVAEYARVAQAIAKNTDVQAVMPYHVAAVALQQTQNLDLARTLVQASPQAQVLGNNNQAREAFVNQTLREAIATVNNVSQQEMVR